MPYHNTRARVPQSKKEEKLLQLTTEIKKLETKKVEEKDKLEHEKSLAELRVEEQQLSVQLEASVVPRYFPTTQDTPPLDTIAPAGYHYMPDGTLMSDIEHMELYGTTPSVESARLYDATSSATKYYNPYERDPVSTNAPLSGINKVITDLEIDLNILLLASIIGLSIS